MEAIDPQNPRGCLQVLRCRLFYKRQIFQIFYYLVHASRKTRSGNNG
jgi:hypothetical protein